MREDEARTGLDGDVIELATHGDGLTTDIVTFFDAKSTVPMSEAITQIRPVEVERPVDLQAPTEVD
jgi:hypothetical protein